MENVREAVGVTIALIPVAAVLGARATMLMGPVPVDVRQDTEIQLFAIRVNQTFCFHHFLELPSAWSLLKLLVMISDACLPTLMILIFLGRIFGSSVFI